LGFHIRAGGVDSIHMEISDTIAMPSGGLRVIPPLPEGRRMSGVSMERGASSISGNELHIHQLPCVAEIRLCGEGSISET
jgi:hypothetical protein